MNWFEPVFDDLLASSIVFAEFWRLVALVWMGQVIAMLVGLRHVLVRLLAGGVGAAAWLTFMPDAPLSLLGGRIGGLQDDAIMILAMMGIGGIGLLMSVRKPEPPVLAGSAALAVIGTLGYLYHVVLINGVDEAQRAAEARDLAEMLLLEAPAFEAICGSSAFWCGDGYPKTDNPRFNKDLSDWFGFTEGATGGNPQNQILFSSNGAVTSLPTYVWAARLDGEDIRWIARSYQTQTDALELGFRILMSIASAFWVSVALFVEWGHRRVRRKASAQLPALLSKLASALKRMASQGIGQVRQLNRSDDRL